MKRRILSLSVVMIFTAVSIFGCFKVFADDTYIQRVALKSYQPPVKTLLFDEDFDDCSEDSEGKITRTVESAYNYTGISSSGHTIVADADGGKAMKLGSSSNYITFNNTLSSDKIVVSFDMYCESNATADSANTNKLGFTFSNKGSTFFNAVTWASSSAQSGITGSIKFNSVTLKSVSSMPCEKWVNVSAEFERVLNADATGYEVKINKLWYDGESIDVSSASASGTFDWWTKTTSSNFSLKPDGAAAFDNVIIYEPQDVEEEVETITTKVTKPSYLPEIGTLVFDDDFEESYVTTTNYINSDYAYSCVNSYSSMKQDSTNTPPTYGLMTSTDNTKYVAFNIWGRAKSKITGAVNSDKFVVTFDFMPPASASGKGFNIYFDATNSSSSLRLIFTTADDNNYKMTLSSTSTTSGTVLSSNSNVTVPIGAFSKLSCVLEKVTVDGADKAILSEAYLNDTKLDLADDIATRYLAGNWFTSTTNALVGIGNFSLAGFGLDNILAYAPAEPVEFKADKAVLSSDASSAQITFTDTIGSVAGAAVTLSDALGNEIASTLSYTGKVLTAAFNTPADIGEKVYTLRVSGVANERGETAAQYSKIYGLGIANIDLTNGSATIRNALNTVMAGKLIIAAYDGDNNLLGISNADVSVPVDLSQTVAFTAPVVSAPAKYKFFVWNDVENLFPYCAHIEIPAE